MILRSRGQPAHVQQQQVEIVKVLFTNAEIIILDEPTAVLPPQEVEGLI